MIPSKEGGLVLALVFKQVTFGDWSLEGGHMSRAGMAGWCNLESPDTLYFLLKVDAPKVKHSII